MIDEVGQYIGSDGNLMLNLQTIVEEIGSRCGGRVWGGREKCFHFLWEKGFPAGGKSATIEVVNPIHVIRRQRS